MIFNWKKQRTQGLMAASLYEPLTDTEQRELNRALEGDAALRSEYESMRRLVRGIPETTAGPVPDLLPLLHERLNAAPRRNPASLFAYGAAAILLVAVSLGVWYANRSGAVSERATPVKMATADTLVSQALAEAETLLAKNDFPAALDVLRKAISRQPGDAQAGKAQWLVADCAFKLKRYPDAYAACNQLFASYSSWLENDTTIRTQAINLRDLLEEAKQVDFASLQAFDAAKRDRTNTFAALEKVAANYAKYQGAEQYALGDLVAKEMAATVALDAGIDIATPAGALAAYQRAHDRCTSPVAVALLDMKIGDTYVDTLHDRASAQEHYRRAAENPMLASLAAKALDRLK